VALSGGGAAAALGAPAEAPIVRKVEQPHPNPDSESIEEVAGKFKAQLERLGSEWKDRVDCAHRTDGVVHALHGEMMKLDLAHTTASYRHREVGRKLSKIEDDQKGIVAGLEAVWGALERQEALFEEQEKRYFQESGEWCRKIGGPFPGPPGIVLLLVDASLHLIIQYCVSPPSFLYFSSVSSSVLPDPLSPLMPAYVFLLPSQPRHRLGRCGQSAGRIPVQQ
jgi:hypothetical protein